MKPFGPTTSCLGKKRFDSARLAHEVNAKRNRSKKREPREAYHCIHCGGYHLGAAATKPSIDYRKAKGRTAT